ncbi:segregation/condensation protein A [Candidatus Woesearchaeota archaeon]|jgi:segregation and condensation protein A|nr:segregation/condensation protein A [Candidatus Woesearchaeota archaeon]
MYDKLMSILTEQDEITWKSLLYELIKTEQMDPWDVDVSELANKYITLVKKMTEMNLRVSGKVLLAAAILLKIKSDRLVGSDMMEFDRLLATSDDSTDLYDSEEDLMNMQGVTLENAEEQLKLIPRTPQPRKRKVSVYDLVDALSIALNVSHRRVLKEIDIPHKFNVPKKTVDISVIMTDLYQKICEFFDEDQSFPSMLTFTELCPSEERMDKVLTFIPLLHLSNSQKIGLRQQDHFGEINIHLPE